MKSKKLVGLLALASCVILGGCGPAKPESDDPVTPPPAPVVPEIEFLEFPEVVFLGETLDLDEFVSIRNASSYSVELAETSKGLASLDGHKITVTGEGELKFTVKAGEKSAEKILVAEAEARYRVSKHFEGMGNNYSVECYDAVISHGNGFVWEDVYDMKTGSLDESFGFVNLDENPDIYYMGERSYNSKKEAYEYDFSDQTIYTGSTLVDYYNAPVDDKDLGLDINSLPIEFLEGEEEGTGDYFLVVEGNDLENLLLMFFMPNNVLGYYYVDEEQTSIGELVATRAYLSYGEYEGSDITVASLFCGYDKVDMEIGVDGYIDEDSGTEVDPLETEGYFDDYYFFNAKNGFEVSDESLASIVGDSKYAPEAVDLGALVGLDTLFENIFKTGSVEVDYFAGWVDNDGESVDTPADLEDTIFAGVFEPVSSARLIGANGYVEVDENFAPNYGLVNKDDKTYYLYAGEEAFEPVESEFEDAWEDQVATMQVLADSKIMVADLFCDYMTDQTGSMIQLQFNAYRQDAFINAIFSTQSDLAVMAKQITSVSEERQINFFNYFESTLTLLPSYGVINFDTMFGWDANTSYEVSITISYNELASGNVDYVIENMVNWPVEE